MCAVTKLNYLRPEYLILENSGKVGENVKWSGCVMECLIQVSCLSVQEVLPLTGNENYIVKFVCKNWFNRKLQVQFQFIQVLYIFTNLNKNKNFLWRIYKLLLCVKNKLLLRAKNLHVKRRVLLSLLIILYQNIFEYRALRTRRNADSFQQY